MHVEQLVGCGGVRDAVGHERLVLGECSELSVDMRLERELGRGEG